MQCPALIRFMVALSTLSGAVLQAHAGDTMLSCVIQPSIVVALGSPAEGILETLAVQRGDMVREGQVIAVLESSLERAAVALAKGKAEAEAALLSTQTRIEFSARKLARAEDLFMKQTYSDHELDEAKTERALAETNHQEALEKRREAELELQRALAALALRTIRSPIAGIIVERFVSPGELVKLTPIVKLANIHPLRVETFAPIAWLKTITIGMAADVIPEAPIAGVYRAKVVEVSQVLDAASGTVDVRLELPNPDLRLPAGVKCTVRFLSE